MALAGVSGLAVIETADALLVVDRQNSDAVRGVVDALAKSRTSRDIIHAREIRPWGQFTVLHEEAAGAAPGYKVKEVVLDGHGQMTFQYHPGRDETWVIVEGEALIQHDGDELRLSAGQSITVPRGTRHRLSNPAASG